MILEYYRQLTRTGGPTTAGIAGLALSNCFQAGESPFSTEYSANPGLGMIHAR